MNRAAFRQRLGSAIALALAGAAPNLRAQTVDQELGIAAGDRYVWLYRRDTAGAGRSLLRVAVRDADAPIDRAFAPLRSGPLVGNVRHAAALGDYLYVFFADGSYRRYLSRLSAGRVLTEPEQFQERNLPGAVVPAALTADESQSAIYALVTTRQAEQAEEARVLTSFDKLDEDGRRGQEGSSANQPPPKALRRGAERAIVRYTQGRWAWDREAPLDATLSARMVALAVRGGEAHLFYRTADADDTLRHRLSDSPTADWGVPSELPIGESSSVAVGWFSGRLALIEWHEEQAGVYEVRVFADGEWASQPPLQDVNGDPLRVPSPSTAAVGAAGAVTLSLDDRGAPVFTRWPTATGKPQAEPAQVDALIAPPPPPVSPTILSFVEYAVLAAVLGAVFVWRRERFMAAAPLATGVVAAKLSKRALALLVDLAIVSPAWVFATYYFSWGGPDVWPSWNEVIFGGPSVRTTAVWFRGGVGLILGLYAIPFELLGGSTPGKRIAGCRVLREDGARCGFVRVIVRNLARAVEFHFAPLFVLVFLTPTRQRVGDLLAATVVTEPTTENAPPTTESTEP